MLNPNLINQLRSQVPLVHNITNIVVANFVVNGLLAMGASPFMADDEQEMEDVAKISNVLSINIGTLNQQSFKAMMSAAKFTQQQHKPLLLDPVGCGATSLRQHKSIELLENNQFSAIRGNAGELAYLAGINWQVRGVDAGAGNANLAEIALTVAKKYQCLVVLTGETDYLSDGYRIVAVKGGSALLPMVTGSGCLHGALCAAFLAIEISLSSLVTACAFYSVAAEYAEQKTRNINGASGSFIPYFLDALSQVSAQDIKKYAQVEEF